MASKLARQITMLLLAHDTVVPFRSNQVAGLIDDVLKGKTISKKEVARLQENEQILSSAIDANNDLLRTNSELKRELRITDRETSILAEWLVVQEKVSKELQEKLTISVQNEAQAKEAFATLKDSFNHLTSLFVVHIADTDAQADSGKNEPLIPPPCLKPRDAMKWSEQTMFASEVKS